MPVGYPKTESNVEMRILKHLFSPIEAVIAVKLGWMPETVRQIHRRIKKVGISRQELKIHLENMGKRGVIYHKKKGRKNYYRGAMFAIGIFEFQVGRLNQETMQLFDEYWEERFANEVFKNKINQLRSVPVEKSIPIDKKIYSYENVKKLIKKSPGPFGVAECICRKGQDLLGNPCKRTELRESCLVFRETADLYISHQNAREITKKESLKILEKAENAGLIIQPGNSKRLNFICTCCSCCCQDLRGVKKYPRPVELYHTNFYAVVDKSTCTGCGNCSKRCNMDAISIIEKKANINLDRCIGCGQCVIGCPTQSICLDKKAKKKPPPRSQFRLYIKLNNKKNGKWSSIKLIFNMIRKMNIYYLLKKNKRFQNNK
ncbi:MAG: DUF362 domain-containing protein [Promethearchaeota archaeon]